MCTTEAAEIREGKRSLFMLVPAQDLYRVCVLLRAFTLSFPWPVLGISSGLYTLHYIFLEGLAPDMLFQQAGQSFENI